MKTGAWGDHIYIYIYMHIIHTLANIDMDPDVRDPVPLKGTFYLPGSMYKKVQWYIYIYIYVHLYIYISIYIYIHIYIYLCNVYRLKSESTRGMFVHGSQASGP